MSQLYYYVGEGSGFPISTAGSGCIIFPEWPLFRGKNVREKAFGTEISVRLPEFRGGRFSEVGNVL